jgi:hypothetical protein
LFQENNPSLCSSVSFVDNNLNDTNIIINSQSTSLNCKSVSNSEPAKQTNQDDEECFHETDKLSESSYSDPIECLLSFICPFQLAAFKSMPGSPGSSSVVELSKEFTLGLGEAAIFA